MISIRSGGAPRAAALLAASLLGGCGHSLSVKHYLAPRGLTPDQALSVSRMFLIVKAPPEEEVVLFGLTIPGKRPGYRFTRAEVDEFARRSMTAITEDPAAFVGYQVHYTDAPPPWMKEFAPTASLWIEPSRFEVRDVSQVAASTAAAASPRKAIHFTVDWKLYQEPGHSLLAQGRHPAAGEAVLTNVSAGSKDDDELVKSKLWDAALKYVPALKERILPRTVVRQRAIYKGKGRGEEAFKAAKAGDLRQAAAIWREEAQGQPPSWESAYNLGVYSEHEQRVPESKNWYQQAAAAAPAFVRMQIEAILGEISRIMSSAKTAPAGAPGPRIYRDKIAVLPFTNETVDMNADSYLRLKTIEVLQARGYPMKPMPEIDQKLLEMDIREGGHLRISSEKELAKKLEVDRLIYGNVVEFKVVNIGVYYKRHVELELRMSDAQGKTVWRNTGKTIYQTAAKPKEAAAAFLVSLAATQIQKMAKTHLKAEADETVFRCLETLPRGFPSN